jgi:competence protein ComEC
LRTGESWQLLLKLKHNNGYQNLNSFDYEKWLFYKRINATGYVRTLREVLSGNSTISPLTRIGLLR